MSSPEHKIIVADPLPENFRLVELSLRHDEGIEVVYAPTLKDVADMLASEPHDVLILDVDMPDGDSTKFCANLCKSSATVEVPVILLSARNSKQALLAGFESGAVDYITKPFYPMELAARVKSQLQIGLERKKTLKELTEKRQLIQVMCHDVTGPMSYIQLAMELIKEDPDMLSDHYENMWHSLEKVFELTDLVRQMSSYEDGKMNWITIEIPLKDAIDDAISVQNERAKGKGLTFNLEVEPDLVVNVEPVSFTNSVLANLISNAVKFSYPDSHIDIKASRQDNLVRLEVRDYGMGMPESLVKDLFSVHTPTSRPGTAGEKGTGYGMPLVKKFLNACGADLSVNSWDIKNFPDRHGTSIEIVFFRSAEARNNAA